METFVSEFTRRIRRTQLRIAVVGLGYVGLPLAIEFCRKGFSVLGIESDHDRLTQLRKGISYITDVATSQLRQVIRRGRLQAEGDFSSLQEADAILICVPTPLKRKYHPDISFIKAAVKKIARNIKKKAVVILESTTYPGTTQEVILPLFEAAGLRHGKDFYLCFSPERIDPGNKRFPLQKIPKVLGGLTPEATRLGVLVYQQIIGKVVPVSSARVAETVKLLENTFRLINIGLVDEMAMMAHKMQIDIWEVIRAAATKPFGFMTFYPGPGVGGHCIPKDPIYLYWKARHHGFRCRFIKLASEIISEMPRYVVDRIDELLATRGKALSASSVLVIGATYKKDIKDLRKSPALEIIDYLRQRSLRVAYHDPLIPYLRRGPLNLKSVTMTAAELKKYDCVVVATDHTAVNYDLLRRHSRLIFDTRNVYAHRADTHLIRL